MNSKHTRITLLLAVLSSFLFVHAANAAESGTGAETLTRLSRAHEEVAKSIPGDHTAVVVQKGDKQFTIYGVVAIRAVGPVLEITVKNGEKYSVSAADIFFITNNGFKI